ncbi:MAG: SRPBCC family protein [Sporichthyaceae bacterium]
MPERDRFAASTEIAASPESVYAMISDLTRMGEWSPENTGGKWIGKAEPGTVGAKFKGKNKNGKKTWSAAVVVTEASAPKRFAFSTVVGPIKAADWSYEITPTATGCQVSESWVDRRPAPLASPKVYKALTGVTDRSASAKAGIEATLANLKKAAESSS